MKDQSPSFRRIVLEFSRPVNVQIVHAGVSLKAVCAVWYVQFWGKRELDAVTYKLQLYVHKHGDCLHCQIDSLLNFGRAIAVSGFSVATDW